MLIAAGPFIRAAARWKPWGPIAVLAVGLGLTRLPILSSDGIYLDGDESLLGLMVLHVLEGGPVPVFPYGANFGVSLVEVVVAALASTVFGLSETTLRASMLLIWSVASLCLIGSIARFSGRRAAWAGAALIAATPGWLHFSSVFWGYTQSAFLACNASLLVVSALLSDSRVRAVEVFGLSALASLSYFTQPIYALGLLPFLGLLFLRRRRVSDVGILALGFLLCSLGYLLLRGSNPYWAPPLFDEIEILSSLASMPYRIWVHATGLYFLAGALHAGPLIGTLTACWLALVVAAAGAAGWHAIRRRRLDPAVACILSILLVYAFNLLVNPRLYGFRYLLPTIGFQVILVATQLERWWRVEEWRPRLLAGGVLLLLLAAAASTLEVRHAPFSGSRVASPTSEREGMRELLGFLDEHAVEHVYCFGPMLQWKLMFASRGRIKARWVEPRDRLPEVPLAVDRAFGRGEAVALFGETEDPAATTAQLQQSGLRTAPVMIAGRYFVVLDPPVALVRRFFRRNE